jgi:hypothetical protein
MKHQYGGSILENILRFRRPIREIEEKGEQNE